MPSLFVIRGNDQGCRFELSADSLTLGRDSSNRIQLHDNEVSRRHAELRRQGQQFHIVDLASSNGTFVDGKRVGESVLRSGAQVQLGRSLLLYTGGSDESQAELRARVDIISRGEPGDSSRIVRSISQEEGSRVFEFGKEDSQSPWLARARSNLQVMYHTALAVSHTLDIDQLLVRILELVFEWVQADRGCIMLIGADGQLEPRARRDRQGQPSLDRLSISQTILDYVIKRREGVLTSDAREDGRWNTTASIVQQGVHEAICVPMQGRYDLVGVIYIDTSTPPEKAIESKASSKFHEDHLKLLIAIAHQAALAVEDTRYYSAMMQAERLAAMGQTIATLSHHIKNILQGIRGGSYLIELGLSQHDEGHIRKGWGIVERRQEQISNLVMDMLTFSKDREPELVPSRLNEVVQDVVELVETKAKEHGVALTWKGAEPMPICVFDSEGLHRAILNVVSNAIDACEEAEVPRVAVSTEYHADLRLLRVVVEDSGSGIEADDIETIFTPFVSHKGNRGTGLGLPVSRKILREHGGDIRVTSTPGEGSQFVLELPAVEADGASLSQTLGNSFDPASL